MVAYETWVSIVRDDADQKGADVTDFETNSTLVSVAAELWRNNEGLRNMTEGEAMAFAQRHVEVS